MSTDEPGHVLPLLLLGGFRTIVDAVHVELAAQGHPEARPVHGFVLQAVGPDGATAADIGRRLGVSKQAAGKHVDALVRLGYVRVDADPTDGRRRIVRRTDRGHEFLVRSEAVFDTVRARWAAALGAERLRALEHDLRRVVPGAALRLDVPGWFGG